MTNNSSDSSLDPTVIGYDTSFSSSKDQILPLTSTIGHKGDQKLSSSTRSVELAFRNEKKNVAAQHQFMDTTSFTASLEATNEHDHEYQDCNTDILPCEILTLYAPSSTLSDEKMMFHARPRSPHPVIVLRGIGAQQSQSAPIIRDSPTISYMQEGKSLTAATWHPISNSSTKSSFDVPLSPRPQIMSTTDELHQYIDYLHSSKMEAESKLARLQTDFDSLIYGIRTAEELFCSNGFRKSEMTMALTMP